MEYILAVLLIVVALAAFVDLQTLLGALIQKPFNRILQALGLQQKPHTTTNLNDPLAGIIGTKAKVVAEVNCSGGRVRAGNTDWKAVATDKNIAYSTGQTVVVVGVEGATLIVKGVQIAA